MIELFKICLGIILTGVLIMIPIILFSGTIGLICGGAVLSLKAGYHIIKKLSSIIISFAFVFAMLYLTEILCSFL